MSLLRLYTLGRLRMQHDQAVVNTFPTRHVEELLAFFALYPRVRHSREKLIDVLWPHETPENARGRFSTVLWRLRSSFNKIGAVPDNYLQATRDWVSFAPAEPVELDLRQFEDCARQARAAVLRDPSRETLLAQESLLTAAVNLYKGELYEGIYTDWCLVERERLARLYLWMAGQLMVCLMQRTAYEEAVNFGRQILERDPLREEVHRAIMRCYWLTNRHTEAVQQYRECARLLEEELRALPMPETITLYREITADELQRSLASGRSQADPEELQAALNQFEQAAAALDGLLNR